MVTPGEARLLSQWRDWRNGIPPSRDWSGRGAQNYLLLAAFDALEQGEVAVQNGSVPSPEPTDAFVDRVRGECR